MCGLCRIEFVGQVKVDMSPNKHDSGSGKSKEYNNITSELISDFRVPGT